MLKNLCGPHRHLSSRHSEQKLISTGQRFHFIGGSRITSLTPVTMQVTIVTMIKSFKHKGLKKLFESGYTSGVNPQHTDRIRKILALLETSDTIDDLDLPGLKLHNLKGKKKDTLSVKVSGNWRITFKIKDGDVFEVNYEDYH